MRSPLPMRWALVAVALWSVACTPTVPNPSGAASPRSAQAPRVLLIGLDGFRADYLERPAAVNLRALAARGVRAERMISAFPSKTFPNHYSIVTGLYPEHHGIVANAMRDSATIPWCSG